MTFEQLDQVLQAHRNLENLRHDIRSNAAEYEAQLAQGRPLEEVKAVMAADAREYERRLLWHADFTADPARDQAFSDALSAMGLDRGEHDAIFVELADATARQQDGLEDVKGTAAALLATVAPHEKIYGFGDQTPAAERTTTVSGRASKLRKKG